MRWHLGTAFLLFPTACFAADIAPPVDMGETPPMYGSAPAYGGPVYGGPAYREPMYGESTDGEPVYGEPVYRRPVYHGPVYRGPAYSGPAYREPMYDEPVYGGRPMYDGPDGGPIYGEMPPD
jgi:hypothetical protein